MHFRHERIDENPPCSRLTFCLATDLTGNDRDDVIVGGMGARDYVFVQGSRTRIPSPSKLKRRLGFPETNLFWYENPGWQRHIIADVDRLGVGHAMADIDGDGRTDLVAGQSLHNDHVYWFERPANPRDRWPKRVITDKYEKYHDLAVGDVDNDGEPEVVGLSQEDEAIFYYDIPEDPTQEPWPDTCHHVVARVRCEGIAVVDIDDGRNELVAGTDIYRAPEELNGPWPHESFASGWDDTRVAVGDVDGDGIPEIVLSEGDSPTYGTHPARVAVVDGPGWETRVLRDDLFCPHSLQLADLNGSGTLDIYVGEMGLGKNPDPEHLLFTNNGNGTFTERIIGRGIPTHEAKAANLVGDGRVGIAGKAYGPASHVDVWYNEP